MPRRQLSSRRESHADDTRRALLAAARRAFARKGYADTSLDDIVGPARVTKGALYHHFSSKEALLAAVYVALEQELVARVRTAVEAAGDDASARHTAALEAFLDASAEPEYVRIVLRDAPHVLGAQQGRELDQRIGLDLVCELVTDLAAAGRLPKLPVQATARVLLAAVSEVVLSMAESKEPRRARKEGSAVLAALFEGLALRAADEQRPDASPRTNARSNGARREKRPAAAGRDAQ